MTRARPNRMIAALGALAVIAGACGSSGGGGNASSPAGSDAPLAPPSAPPVETAGPAAGGPGQFSLRVANFIAGGGVASPPIDIYDDSLKANGTVVADAKPLIAGLAFGAVSTAVRPVNPPNNGGIHLYAMPAGASPARDGAQAQQFFYAVNEPARATIVLTDDSDDPPTSDWLLNSTFALSTSSVLEQGGAHQNQSAPPAPPAEAGQAMLLAYADWLPRGMNQINYLMIDGACQAPLNGPKSDNGTPMIFADRSSPIRSMFSLFPVSPGKHHVAVVAWDQVRPTATCAALVKEPQQGSQDVTLAAGQQDYAWVYGASASKLGIAIAPMLP